VNGRCMCSLPCVSPAGEQSDASSREALTSRGCDDMITLVDHNERGDSGIHAGRWG
jgi:hypothetical protein